MNKVLFLGSRFNMKIIYKQAISSERVLGRFVERVEPEYRREDGVFIARLSYDLEGLAKQFTQQMQIALQGAGYTATMTADDRLWVSSPEAFSLRLEANLPDVDVYDTNKRRFVDIQLEEMVKTKGSLPFGWLRREKPLYHEKPGVQISGMIMYEKLVGVDPAPLLKVLRDNGYEAEVVPTSKEIEEAAGKILSYLQRRTSARGTSQTVNGGAYVVDANTSPLVDGDDWGELGALLGGDIDGVDSGRANEIVDAPDYEAPERNSALLRQDLSSLVGVGGESSGQSGSDNGDDALSEGLDDLDELCELLGGGEDFDGDNSSSDPLAGLLDNTYIEGEDTKDDLEGLFSG